MRNLARVAAACLFATASSFSTGCTVLFGDDLEGLKPYPPDVVPDSIYVPGSAGRGVPILSDAALVVTLRPDGGNAYTPDASNRDASLDDIVTTDRGSNRDASLDEIVGDEVIADGSPVDVDAGLDGRVPTNDGGIVGIGGWVISGGGPASLQNYQVRGWMVPTTSFRAVTGSGLTIEGWLQ